MKATGIVRRIDELGRIVIPKEIRRTLRIRESDPVEIYTNDEGCIILKKFSPIAELGDFAGDCAKALNGCFGVTAAVCDMERVIGSAGALKKGLTGKALSPRLEEHLRAKRVYMSHEDGSGAELVAGQDRPFDSAAAVPIILNGDAVGGILLCSVGSSAPAKSMGEAEIQALKTSALFLALQLL